MNSGETLQEKRQAEAVTTSTSTEIHVEDKRIASFGDVLMMNLGIIVAGVVTGWNSSLYIGYGEYLINLALCSFSYICLSLCIAEMAGIIAFSGGSYGYCRCTLSPFIGYLVGMCDLLQSVLYTASFANVVAVSLAVAVSGEEQSWTYTPLWWIAVYVSLILFALPGGRFFWNSVVGFTVLSMVMMLLYCLGLANKVDSKFFTLEFPAFAGSAGDFLDNLIVPTVCYVGVDLITLFGEEAKDPQKHIPTAMISAILITIGFAWWVTVTCIGVFPGVGDELINGGSIFPMQYGFQHLFDISANLASLLIAPTVYSSAMGFLFAAGRQMSSMSKSGLLPQCLSITYGPRKVPIAAYLATAVLGIIAMLPVWGIDPASDDLYKLSMIGACCVYVCMFWCYLVFKIRYESMDRTFVNPLGVASAVYGIVYYIMVLGTVFFGQLDFDSLLAFVPYMGLSILYYYRVVESRQFFSKDEQAKFMKAYILNANRRKKKGPQSALSKHFTTVMVTLGFAEKGSSGRSAASNNSKQGSKNPSRNSSVANSPRSEAKSSIIVPASQYGGPFEASITSTLQETDVAVKSSPVSNKMATSKSSRIVPMVSLSAAASKALEERAAQLVDLEADLIITGGVGTLPPVVVDNVQWSGKLMGENESRRFFEIVHNHHSSSRSIDDNGFAASASPEEDLVTHLPEQFVRVPEDGMSTRFTTIATHPHDEASFATVHTKATESTKASSKLYI